MATKRNETVLSRRQIEGLIADGKTVMIVDQKVLKIDAWLPYHPGGDLAIRHMIGRDATDEVTVIHSAETKETMFRYQIGRIEGRWQNFIPPIRGGKFRPYLEGKSEDEYGPELDQDASSSTNTSPSATPIFEPPEAGEFRRRGQGERSSSVSSISSLNDEESDPTGMGHIDFLTKQEIKLDLEKYPDLDPDTQAEVIRKYRLLNERIKAEGLYECNYWNYGRECIRYTLFFSLMMYFLRKGWYCTSGFFLGLFWHQLVFSVHDLGHMGVTHNFVIDTTIGIIIADFIGGLSLGWWKRSHNVHHIITNHPEHDPDIEYVPIFAVTHQFFKGLWSTYHEKFMVFDRLAKILIPVQGWLYYPILTFGRFNLYVLAWTYLLKGQGPKKGPAWWLRWFEYLGQVVFWYWFGYLLLYKTIPTGWARFGFVMISHMTTMPVHVQITLSHFAMSTTDLGPGESFAQRMLRTTMDVDCPEWLDFFHGGLQFQAIHHLFPRIPRHNLRKTQKLVQEFCLDVGIPYALYGFVDGNKQVIGRLSEVGRQAAILAKCQQSLVENEGGLFHSH